MNYKTFFEKATDNPEPYPFQERFAVSEILPHLLRAPTGAGKTATAVLGWLWRWYQQKPETPRRLVYCLPMRVLVEQSVRETQKWIENLVNKKILKERIAVHVLMGGIDTEDWFLHPEKPAILIGTQDMLLSRALNRGYAASRFHWPIDFGFLNNDCLWIFDEPQLMGNGVSTSAQLAGLRQQFQTFGKCLSIWMSATLEQTWLDTVDFKGKFLEPALELTDADYDPSRPLYKRMTAEKILQPLGVSSSKDMKEVAKKVIENHIPGTQTLVVVNTVDRAKLLYTAIQKDKKASKMFLLVHSRFRPMEREILNQQLQERGEITKDRIIIATQVVEAGVDISARTLITELAPWASIVQRMGRCNRTGDDGPGQVFWINLDEKSSAPYEGSDLEFAKKQLEQLNNKIVSPKALEEFKQNEKIVLPFEHKHVLRRRDLLDLFDTTPDLSGNDIDIQRFVRSDDPDIDVQVFWRDGEPIKDWSVTERRQNAARREELCNVPIGDFKKFLESDRTAYRWDYLDKRWYQITKRDATTIIPGQMFWVSKDQGGYNKILGWNLETKQLDSSLIVSWSIEPEETSKLRSDTAYDTDDWSHFQWRTIAEHTDEVVAEFEGIRAGTEAIRIPSDIIETLQIAARWHDWGKSHAVFQTGIRNEVMEAEGDTTKPKIPRPDKWKGCDKVAKAPDEFWGTYYRKVDEKLVWVKRFRHELASALGVLGLFRSGQGPADWKLLSEEQRNLAIYLIAAHHGKIRLSIRTMPDEKPIPADPKITCFAAGVWDGDSLPVTDLGNGIQTREIQLDLSPIRLGKDSWTFKVITLRDQFGPFRLAYLEALIRAADCRASNKSHTEGVVKDE